VIPGIIAGQATVAGGGGGTPGAWNPADVAMDTGTFTFTNSDATVDNDTGQGGVVRNTTNKTGAGNKRYAEIVVDDYGNLDTLGMFFGFSATGSTLNTDWSNGANSNATVDGSGIRYSYGQTNTDTAGGSDVNHTASPGDVFGLRIEIGVGAQVNRNNGPWRAFPTFTEGDVQVFAALGNGNFGNIGDNFMLTILTTAATQTYSAPAGYTPWDD
jgi:hypothetical protein